MRTWPRGRNADYVGRVLKSAQEGQWALVVRAIRAAADRVRFPPAAVLGWTEGHLPTCRQGWCWLTLMHCEHDLGSCGAPAGCSSSQNILA